MNPLPPKHQTPRLLTTDETFVQAAALEFEQGYVRLNLMNQALRQAAGNEQQAQLIYLQQVAIALKKEQKIKARLQHNMALPADARGGFFQRCADSIQQYWYILPAALLLAWGTFNPAHPLLRQTAERLGFTSSTAPVMFGQQAADPTDLIVDGQPIADPRLDGFAAPSSPVTTPENIHSTNPASDRQVLSYLPKDGKVQIPTEQPSTKPMPACQHKSVMSNQDYLNCGLTPPKTPSNHATDRFDPTF